MVQKQRILFLHLGQTFGGIEVYMANLAKLLRDDAEIVAWCSHPNLIERLEAQSVTIVRLPEVRGPLRGLRFLMAAILLPFVLLRYKIDTVHINGHWESILLLPCRLFGRRAISTRHQTWDIPLRHWWHAPKRTISGIIYNVNAKFAHQVVCVSNAVASEVNQHVNSSKIAVIPNWISQQKPFIQRSPITGKANVLFVGRMVIFKGLQLLLEAMTDLPDVKVTAVGEGPLLDQFREQSKHLDVTFLGFHQDVEPFYLDADLFVMPSIGLEGLPLVSLEAMGHGIPCIFSDLAVHREITVNGEAARLFSAGNSDDLRHQLKLLLQDESEMNRLALAGYTMVQQHYVASVARRSYVKVFQLEEAHTGNLTSVQV